MGWLVELAIDCRCPRDAVFIFYWKIQKMRRSAVRRREDLRCAFGVSELGSSVHAETSSSASESVAFGSVFPTVALLAEDFSRMLADICGIKSFLAQT